MGGCQNPPDPQGSEISDGGGQTFLTHKTRENDHQNTGTPATDDHSETTDHSPASTPPKAEQAQPLLVSGLRVCHPDLSAPGGLWDHTRETPPGDLRPR